MTASVPRPAPVCVACGEATRETFFDLSFVGTNAISFDVPGLHCPACGTTDLSESLAAVGLIDPDLIGIPVSGVESERVQLQRARAA